MSSVVLSGICLFYVSSQLIVLILILAIASATGHASVGWIDLAAAHAEGVVSFVFLALRDYSSFVDSGDL